jgi:dipeptidyl-peptidase-4
MLRCTRVLIWGLLGWVWAQLGLSLAGIWKEYRYGVRGYEFFSGEALWGYEEGAGVVYRFRDAAAAETLWKGAFPIVQIVPSRANPEEVLLFEQVERLYRRSARYRVYLLSGGKVTPIPGLYQEAELLPDGRVILADSQNLYLWHRSSSEPERLTSVRGAMQAGTTDWLYEEEFGFTKAFAASPSGAYLAFLHLDNTETPTWSLAYEDPKSPYPRWHTFPYPKAGQKNPRVALHILSLSDRTDQVLLQDTTGGYLPFFFWSEMGDELYFVHLNRLQNAFTLYRWEPSGKGVQVFFRDSTPYWFNLYNRMLFAARADQPEFFYKAERGKAPVIERHDYKGRRLGQYFVPGLKDLVGYAQGKLFFTAWGKDPTAQRVGYLDFRQKAPTPRWITSDTLWAEAQVSATCIAITESGPLSPPRTYLLDAATLTKRYALPDLNSALRNQIPPLQVRYFRFANEAGDSLWASFLLPADFDPRRKYPVLVRFYGGPGSQMVSRRFENVWFFWEARLVQKGFLVAHVDGRGTGLYEGALRYGIYKNLGTLETADVVAFVKYLRRLPYVGKVYGLGWSFGGYVAARLAMEAPPDALAGVVSIAPVTDWRLYDSAYTERFMQTPAENPEGYARTSLLTMGRPLQAPLLLIHGEADDNVHVQHTYRLIEALLRRYPESPLTWRIYPGQNHGIGRYRYHLFLEVERFLGIE